LPREKKRQKASPAPAHDFTPNDDAEKKSRKRRARQCAFEGRTSSAGDGGRFERGQSHCSPHLKKGKERSSNPLKEETKKGAVYVTQVKDLYNMLRKGGGGSRLFVFLRIVKRRRSSEGDGGERISDCDLHKEVDVQLDGRAKGGVASRSQPKGTTHWSGGGAQSGTLLSRSSERNGKGFPFLHKSPGGGAFSFFFISRNRGEPQDSRALRIREGGRRLLTILGKKHQTRKK